MNYLDNNIFRMILKTIVLIILAIMIDLAPLIIDKRDIFLDNEDRKRSIERVIKNII